MRRTIWEAGGPISRKERMRGSARAVVLGIEKRGHERNMLEIKMIRTLTGWMGRKTEGPRSGCAAWPDDHAHLGKASRASWGVGAVLLERGVVRVLSQAPFQTELFMLGWRKLSAGTSETFKQCRP